MIGLGRIGDLTGFGKKGRVRLISLGRGSTRGRCQRRLAAIIGALVFSVVLVPMPSAEAASIPAGFTDEFLSAGILDDFTDIMFLPDGTEVVNALHGHLHAFDVSTTPSPRSDVLLFLENEIFARRDRSVGRRARPQLHFHSA